MQAEYWDLENKYKESQALVNQLTQNNLNRTLRELFSNSSNLVNERNTNWRTNQRDLNTQFDGHILQISFYPLKTEENSSWKLKDISVVKTGQSSYQLKGTIQA